LKLGRARFYADENVELDLIDYLRRRGVHVDSAVELGFAPRDDRFHLQEARRRKVALLTRDTDLLEHRRFQFREFRDTGIIVLRSERSVGSKDKAAAYGYMIMALADEVAPSGRRNLRGLKIEITGPRITIVGEVRGRVRSQTVDIS
jgi:Domain of unknown function (DUF5615)